MYDNNNMHEHIWSVQQNDYKYPDPIFRSVGMPLKKSFWEQDCSSMYNNLVA